MKNKLFLLVTGILLLSALVFAWGMLRKKPETGINRYEWMQMLTEGFGLTEYSGESPYFQDVAPDSPYFPNIQAACEWTILEDAGPFRGEQPVTGEFAALTAMKAIGKYKVQIYLGLPDVPGDTAYLKLAAEKGVIENSQLKKRMTQAECRAVLERAKQLLTDSLWRDDYAEIRYRDHVTELQPQDILSADRHFTALFLTEEKKSRLREGDILIIPDPDTGLKEARKITQIGANGLLELDVPDDPRFVESLVVSDIAVVSAANLFPPGERTALLPASPLPVPRTAVPNAQTVSVWNKKGTVSHAGVSISVKTDSGKMTVLFKDRETGAGVCLYEEAAEGSTEADITVQLTQITARVQILYDGKNFRNAASGLQYVDAQIETDISCSGTLKMNAEKEIPLGKAVSIPIGGGIAEIQVQFCLVLAADGSVSIDAKVPFRFGAEYVQGSGLRRIPSDAADCTVRLTADCTGAVRLRTAPGLHLRLLFADSPQLLGLSADISAAAHAQAIARANSKVESCADVSIAAPTFSLAVSLHESLQHLLDAGHRPIPTKWDILTEENAPFHASLHHERYADGTSAFVEECTYRGTAAEDLMTADTCSVQFTSNLVKEGEYDTITAKKILYDSIPADTAGRMKEGDTYDFYDTKYIFEGIVSEEALFTYRLEDGSGGSSSSGIPYYYKFRDAAGTEYICPAPPTEPMPTGPLHEPVYVISVYEPVQVTETDRTRSVRPPRTYGAVTLTEEEYSFQVLPSAVEMAEIQCGNAAEVLARGVYAEISVNASGQIVSVTPNASLALIYDPECYRLHP